jgi:hypothetical protein
VKSCASIFSTPESVAIDGCRTVEELAKIVPIEAQAVLKFLDQPTRIEGVPRLPKFQHYEATDQGVIERSCGSKVWPQPQRPSSNQSSANSALMMGRFIACATFNPVAVT